MSSPLGPSAFIGDSPAMDPPTHVVTDPVGALGWRGKRAFDVLVATVLLVLLLPLLVLSVVALRLSSRGPVFFRQTRIGHGGRPFSVLKLRTMHCDSEARLLSERGLHDRYVASDHKIAHDQDPRITRLGRPLRRTSVDELPQLLNVIRGHMSLVGPRPIVPGELASYGELQDVYLAARPGLTGLWQVSGRCQVKFPLRAELDCRYLSRSSLGYDLLILLRTPLAMFERSDDNH